MTNDARGNVRADKRQDRAEAEQALKRAVERAVEAHPGDYYVLIVRDRLSNLLAFAPPSEL